MRYSTSDVNCCYTHSFHTSLAPTACSACFLLHSFLVYSQECLIHILEKSAAPPLLSLGQAQVSPIPTVRRGAVTYAWGWTATSQCKIHIQQKERKYFTRLPASYFLLNYASPIFYYSVYYSVASGSSLPLIIKRRAAPSYCHLHCQQTDEELEAQACYCHWGCSCYMGFSPVPPERHVRLHLPMGAREKWGSGYSVCELPVLLFHIYEVEMFLS